ncbi:MAG: DNA-directed RNA polymerase subunit beta' [Acidimicrobiaceae bacterium]|nr:DNA-directed RNA polymerase subunit beta' [Acidimicrobiaceae bacterium]MCY4280295.1 DNA-directed RNA polymerase subunit beta' [Acidimicrobiaceae bacterium]
MLDVNDFSDLKIGLASADSIRTWSNGEVKKPETINYRTLKPEKDGLFCEKIFGPTRDWECSCGKYKRVRFKGIICERCNVEVTRSKVRRERMGHIELAAPAVHIWYLRGTRSWLAYLLMGTKPREELKAKQLEKVIYFGANIVIGVDEERRHEDLPELEAEIRKELDGLEADRVLEITRRQEQLETELAQAEERDAKATELRALQRQAEKDIEDTNERSGIDRERVERAWEVFSGLFSRQIIEDEDLWRELSDRWEDYFEGGQGAAAIARLIASLDFDAEEKELREQINPADGQKPLSAQRKQKAIKRLRILAAFNRRDNYGRRVNDPRAMILDVVPVIPPELRPMVQLDGGRFATSDLNDLYRRVINRNNRLKRLLDLAAPDIIVNNEKRMLQEAVDALFDNGRRGRPVTGPGNRALKSLSDMLKGKQGRFRQNLLGKRVDYSGRSVIVAGPTLRFHQCGLPKIMALELFKPFVMKKLVDVEFAPNIKSAKRMVERRKPQVWDVLEDVITEHPVLLNRAPTLHRLGIQAFEPVLVEGKAIQIHPLVCAAFNADFDGDQMAVHLPLSAESQAEARLLMLSANNVLSPAHGRPLVTPTQDMIIGSHYLTEMVDGAPAPDRAFRSVDEVRFAYDNGDVSLHDPIEFRGSPDLLEAPANGSAARYQPTTAGRVFFNSVMPEGFGYINCAVGQRHMGEIVDRLARGFNVAEVSRCLDAVKDMCFEFASRSGLTISIDDVRTPAQKTAILDRYEKQADKIERQFRRGIITDGERRQLEVEVWSEATEEVTGRMKDELESDAFNPVNMMVGSGARGNMMQIRQIAGMRGLVANPRGDMIPRPIKSNFREGLRVLEYFIATPGARKGLVDTALRTADSGYLTRRLVDVAQEVIINDEDPFASGGHVKGIWLDDVTPDTPHKRTYLDTRLFGRVLAEDVQLDDGSVILAGTMVGDSELEALRDDPEVTRVRVLSPLSDDSASGISAASYGMSLATGKLIEEGEAVGVIAAQSIGEPGTQLTMRTFHTGGVAGAQDIAGGLPRVVELFEARTPKGKAILARQAGVVRIRDYGDSDRTVVIVENDGTEHDCKIGSEYRLEVRDGDEVEPGDALVEGPRDPKELLEIRGIDATQRYLVAEVQKVYRDQGVSIHDKHIELIVRQMTKRVAIGESGDTRFLPDERVDKAIFEQTNREAVRDGGRPASGRREVMGITKASLATDSWLSAASFQETTRVLTEAAIESRRDELVGLKENIIIGKLIPAGTGMTRYRESMRTHAPDHTPMDYFSSEDSLADQLARRYETADGEGAAYAVLDEPAEPVHAEQVPEAG